MSLLPIFDEEPLPPLAARLGPKLKALAEEGIYFGSSSWKFEGWLGQIYSEDHYQTRGKFSTSKFEAECLSEYAKTFPTVCGDFSFYQFPSPPYWRRLFDGAPDDFLFAFKVPEDLTVATWPGHARYGTRAGKENDHFLDSRIFEAGFARPLAPYRNRIATLIFEFGTFPKRTFPDPESFVRRLDPFLGSLPGGFRYAVEIRNPDYLSSDYFAALTSRNIAHVFNAWTRMPEIGDQIDLPGAHTADFTVARALLRRGRSHEDANTAFEPYQLVQDPNPPVREALRRLAERSKALRQKAFLFVNNHIEGNAPGTIAAIVDT